MSIEWLKQYLLWELFFFVIVVVLAFVCAIIKNIARKIKRDKEAKK